MRAILVQAPNTLYYARQGQALVGALLLEPEQEQDHAVIRYLGVLLYDADAIERAASTENEKDLYQRQLDVFLDPNDPKVIEQAL